MELICICLLNDIYIKLTHKIITYEEITYIYEEIT